MMNFLFAQATALELVLMLALSFIAINRMYNVLGPMLGMSKLVGNLTKLALGATSVLMVSFFDGFSSTLMVLMTLVCVVPAMLASTEQLGKFLQWSIDPTKPFNLVYNAVMAAFFLFAVIGEYMVNDTVAVIMMISVLGSAAAVALGIHGARLQRKLAA